MAAVSPDNVPFVPWGLLLIALAAYVVAIAALIAAGRREDARALAGFIPDCLVLVSRLARDRRISRPRRAALFVVLGYLALPIDLVPDFLPGIGQLDDAVVLGLALRLIVRGGGTELVREAWPGPQASLMLVLRAAGLETNGAATPPTRILPMSILEQVQEDVKVAMKAGERERVGQLRMLVNALQAEQKEGKGDEIAALQRERKRRLDAAEALREGDRTEQAETEESEAKLIEGYLPAQLSEEELSELVAGAIQESGATEAKDMGGVMKVLMPKVGGRADGKRVSQAVREKLGA
jgi:hypothetical protein